MAIDRLDLLSQQHSRHRRQQTPLSLLLLVSRHDRSRDMAALINFVVRWSILQFTFWEPPGPLFSNRHQPDPHHDLKQPT